MYTTHTLLNSITEKWLEATAAELFEQKAKNNDKPLIASLFFCLLRDHYHHSHLYSLTYKFMRVMFRQGKEKFEIIHEKIEDFSELAENWNYSSSSNFPWWRWCSKRGENKQKSIVAFFVLTHSSRAPHLVMNYTRDREYNFIWDSAIEIHFKL